MLAAATLPPSLKYHESRGGRLDHEHHEMSENHETASAAMNQTIPRLPGDIASGRAELDILLQKNVAL
jgi:hypothetical protein